jgi:methionyl-tRNA formyltransferase
VLVVLPDGVVIACNPGALMLARVKPEGRSEMSAAEWARGARVEQGDVMEAHQEIQT